MLIAPANTDEVYPRTGGGNGGYRRPGYAAGGLSPHGRGKRLASGLGAERWRSIPARAGETRTVALPRYPPEVYPRTGGGNWGKLQKP